MNVRIAGQPGKRLVRSNNGTGPLRWTGGAPAAAPVPIPSGPLWDEHDWQPDGTHRKTNTAISPEGVPFAYSNALRDASPTITAAEVTRFHSGRIPADYVAEGLRSGGTVEEIEMLWAERSSKGVLSRRFSSAMPAERPQAAPEAPRTARPISRTATPVLRMAAAVDALWNLNIPRKETHDPENQ